MDFSRLPFNSALDRLANLLPIGAFMRLATIQPELEAGILTLFVEDLCTNDDGPLSLQFYQPDDPENEEFWITYDHPDDVLNEGPVECNALFLDRTDIPVEAVHCTTDLWLGLAEPGILPFLQSAPAYVSFDEDIPKDHSLTLVDICAHLGPRVQYLYVPCEVFPEDLSAVRLEKREHTPLLQFQMWLPSFTALITWLHLNAVYFTSNNLCERAVILSPHHHMHNDEIRNSFEGNETECPWLKMLEEAVHPFCRHEAPDGLDCKLLVVLLSSDSLLFRFIPDCHDCRFSESDG